MGINVYHSSGRIIYLYYQLQVEAIVFEYTNLITLKPFVYPKTMTYTVNYNMYICIYL